MLMVASAVQAQRSKPTEYQVKAVYLYNFGKFVSWPEKSKISDTSDGFNLCVLGTDPFGPALEATVSDETVDGRKVVLKRISNAQEAASCRIVFVSASETDHMKATLEALNSGVALTVSDVPGFANQGGMIEFVIEDSRVRFEVNLTAAQHAGLTLSSELLKVATSVKKSPPPGGH